ncbi:MAG: hypothetical protein WC054_00020 [Candidatus Nanopelagicales bacterium]
MTNTANFPRYAPASSSDIEILLVEELDFEPAAADGMFVRGCVGFRWTDIGSRSFRLEQFTSEARWDVIGQVDVSGGLSILVIDALISAFTDDGC